MTETTPDYAGLNLIAEAITEWFGERCPDYAEGCYSCEAWKEYDRLRALLERYEALERERDELKHDVRRYVEIASEEATRAEAAAARLAKALKTLDAIIKRNNNDPLGTSKVNDMRRIAEDAACRALTGGQENG